MRLLLLVAIMLLVLLVPALPAKGQDWEFRLSPYFWAAGVTGDIDFGPLTPTAHVEEGFDDIFNDLQFGAAAIGEARRDRFVLLGDISFADTGSRTAVAEGSRRAVSELAVGDSNCRSWKPP